jgi:putative radical SAM enzyme (TIGR03279 family)
MCREETTRVIVVRITEVAKNSTGQELGLRPGDEIVTINGRPVKDVIDYQFLVTDDEIELEVRRDGKVIIFEVEKEPDDNLGLTFEPLKIRFCGNDCVFCFVDQNPKGMRETMYFRDEDFRLSFLFGHFVTLTNLSRRDIERIITQRLSPLFVSVHATDVEVRKFLFGIRHDDRLFEKLDVLTSNGIEIHTQIVLCPGVNDGDVLRRTLADLARYRPQVRSVAIVPVGLTRHRQGLTPLQPVSPTYARQFVSEVDEYDAPYRLESGEHFVYAADEWYLMAGVELPPAERYDDFCQMENGVGMVRYLLDDFRAQRRRFPKRLPRPKRATLVSGALAGPVLREYILPALNRVANFEASLRVIRNDFYGPTIRVTGLLTAQDIFNQLRGQDLGETLYLPPNCLNEDGLFLDDWSLEDLGQRLGVEARAVPNNNFVSIFRPQEAMKYAPPSHLRVEFDLEGYHASRAHVAQPQGEE